MRTNHRPCKEIREQQFPFERSKMPLSSDSKTGSGQNRAIFDLVQSCLAILSPEGILLDANQIALNFVHVSLQEVVGTPFWETPWWRRDCQKSQDLIRGAIQKGASGKQSRFAAQHTDKEGEIVDIDFSLTPIFDDAGTVVSLLAEARDITAIKQTANVLLENEARLRLAYVASGISIWDWNLTTDGLHWNEREFEFGFPKFVGPMQFGRGMANVHPDDLERVGAAIGASIKDETAVREEFRVIEEDGEVRWIVLQGHPMHRDDSGKPTSMVGLSYDITDQKTVELELAQSNLDLASSVAERTRELQLEMSERHKAQEALSHSQRLELIGQLAGGVAHDFNNLLAVIGGNLELATMRTTDERVSELVHEALLAVEAGAGLSQRLLSFARKRSLQPSNIAVNDRIELTQQLLERTLDKNIAFELILSSDIWKTRVDPGDFDSAILNIVINARDSMQSGGKLRIVTRNRTFNSDDVKSIPEATEIDYVQISVSDTGGGMTPDVQDKALTPFFTTKEAGKGSGLGLSSVFGFAKQSAGFVTIDSVIGEGTAINIYLPRASLPSNGGGAKTQKADVPLGRGETILVVDDEPALLKVVRERLIELGYNVIEATTAAQAIELLEDNELISLVFSDIRMPGRMSGHDLAEWVFENRPDLKVLLTSGYSELAAEEQQDMKILAKPYSMAKLAISLRDALAVDVVRSA
jgi:PAS domain S-box-containing protein